MKLKVGDVVNTLYGTAIVLEVLESGVRVRIFRAYCNYDWLGKEIIWETKDD